MSSAEWTAAAKFSPEAVDFVSKCLVKDANKRWPVSELMKVSVLRESEE